MQRLNRIHKPKNGNFKSEEQSRFAHLFLVKLNTAPRQFSTHSAARELLKSREDEVVKLAPNLEIHGRYGLADLMRMYLLS